MIVSFGVSSVGSLCTYHTVQPTVLKTDCRFEDRSYWILKRSRFYGVTLRITGEKNQIKVYFSRADVSILAYSVDPEKIPRSVLFHREFYCLPKHHMPGVKYN